MKKKKKIYFVQEHHIQCLTQSMITTCDRLLEKLKPSMSATHYNNKCKYTLYNRNAEKKTGKAEACSQNK